MSLASGLYHARKKSGLSPENVAEKLGVSRQTIFKWETGETLPDIRQSKRLAVLYHITLDELAEYDFDEQQAREMIDSVSEEAQAKIDWNRVWSKKYPVLATYHKTVRIDDYAPQPVSYTHLDVYKRQLEDDPAHGAAGGFVQQVILAPAGSGHKILRRGHRVHFARVHTCLLYTS